MSKSICSTGLRWLWVVVAVLALDFGSKQDLANFTLGQSQPLIPSFNLFYARNYGAAFSFLADHGGWQRWFFAGIAIAIVAVLLVMMYRSTAQQKLNNIAYAFIIGGRWAICSIACGTVSWSISSTSTSVTGTTRPSIWRTASSAWARR